MTERWYEELYDHFPDYDEEPYVQNTEAEVDFIERELDRERSSLSSSPRMLDVGCGSGRHALALAQRGYGVLGLDLSRAMVEQGRSRARGFSREVSPSRDHFEIGATAGLLS